MYSAPTFWLTIIWGWVAVPVVIAGRNITRFLSWNIKRETGYDKFEIMKFKQFIKQQIYLSFIMLNSMNNDDDDDDEVNDVVLWMSSSSYRVPS